MKKLLIAAGLLSAFVCTANAQTDLLNQAQTVQSEPEEMVYDPSADEELEKIPVSEVPKAVMDAIKKQQSGIFFTDAERFWLEDMRTYQVNGTRFSEMWTFLVVEHGEILSFEVDRRN